MSFLSTLFSGGDAIKVVGDTVENLFTNNDAREKQLETFKAQTAYDLDIAKIEAGVMAGQVDIDKIEASHPSLFVAGWRPAVGWVCAISLFTYYVPYCLVAVFIWAWQCYTGHTIVPRPDLGIADLIALLTGMLGLSTMRSFDKLKGTETKAIKPKN